MFGHRSLSDFVEGTIRFEILFRVSKNVVLHSISIIYIFFTKSLDQNSLLFGLKTKTIWALK